MAEVRNPTDKKSPRGVPSFGNNPTVNVVAPAAWDALVGDGSAPGDVPTASATAGVSIGGAGGATVVRSVRANVKNVVIDLGAADYNGIQILEMSKTVTWLGGSFDISIAAAGGSAMDTAGVEVGVGTVVAAADPIASTQQNIVTLKAVTLAAKLGRAQQAVGLTSLVGAVSGGDVFLNVSSTEATTGYTVTLNGWVELFYLDFTALTS